MSETTRNQREWENPENWSRLGSYRSAKDSRVFVPNRNRFFLWTFNFAKPQAYLALAGILALGATIAVVAIMLEKR